MNYMQQRYYDPGIGRFLSVDPVTANGNTGANFNRYWYANNNPYRFTDPDGRAVLDDLKREWTAGGGSSCGLRSCFPSLDKKKERNPITSNERDMQKTGDLTGFWSSRHEKGSPWPKLHSEYGRQKRLRIGIGRLVS
jgi:uncharacterized protein RhaS with RHS repeats